LPADKKNPALAGFLMGDAVHSNPILLQSYHK